MIHLTRSRDDRGKTGLLYLTGRRGVVFGRGASYVSPSQTSLLFFFIVSRQLCEEGVVLEVPEMSLTGWLIGTD